MNTQMHAGMDIDDTGGVIRLLAIFEGIQVKNLVQASPLHWEHQNTIAQG